MQFNKAFNIFLHGLGYYESHTLHTQYQRIQCVLFVGMVITYVLILLVIG